MKALRQAESNLKSIVGVNTCFTYGNLHLVYIYVFTHNKKYDIFIAVDVLTKENITNLIQDEK